MRLRLVILPVLVTAALSPSMLPALDWPSYRGPNGTGISLEKGINKAWGQKPPKLLWKTPMSDNGFAGPAVASGKVFIIDHKDQQEVVRAIDVKTGKDVWQYAVADDKRDNWGYARATPAVDKTRVYTVGRMGLVSCLNAATGKAIWTRDLVGEFKGRKPGWNYSGSPLIDGNKLIVAPGGPDGTVVALDKTTGRTLWQGGKGDNREPGYSSPMIATINGKKQYVVFTATDLIGVDAATGAELWKCQWNDKPQVDAAQPIAIGNTFYITNGYGHGCALVEVTPTGAAIKWQNKEMQSHMASPILVNGYVYGTTDPGDFICIDPKTGTTKWRQKGFEKGNLAMVDGVILAFDGAGGDLVMINPLPDAYKELGRFKPLGGTSWTAPAIADGKLYVRNKGELACFDLK